LNVVLLGEESRQTHLLFVLVDSFVSLGLGISISGTTGCTGGGGIGRSFCFRVSSFIDLSRS